MTNPNFLPKLAEAREKIELVVSNRTELIDLMLIASITQGNVLIEGIPGTGKTLICKVFAKVIGGSFKRIQLSPDLLPSDITGFVNYRLDGENKFQEGPVFANVVLADELNRTSARTQTAFLEAMEEHQVTIEGITHDLPEPSLFIATQTPGRDSGTYDLPWVHLDRFMFSYATPPMDRHTEESLLNNIDKLTNQEASKVLDPETILNMKSALKDIHVSGAVKNYILDLISWLRQSEKNISELGARSSINLLRSSRAYAMMQDRDYVIPDDIRYLSKYVLSHRIKTEDTSGFDLPGPYEVIHDMITTVPIPRTPQ